VEHWHKRWLNNQTGWHKSTFNELLVNHWPAIDVPPNCNVMVPMCGKSLDMIWLAQQGHSVTGFEMVKKAVTQFFSENQLDYEIEDKNGCSLHVSEPFAIHHGDFFQLKPEHIQADAWYDRAAIIAIEPSMRQAYVKQIRNQTRPGAIGLLITFAYPQEQMQGPPFSLHDEDVMELFSNGFEVKCLEHVQLDDEKERGLTYLTSSVFKITRNED
tara:strand:+ start:1231 stop:1872 length:642 start_codon:yes stop_codon:yes gene_type:complete